jgi:hypothetical protein
LNDASDEEEEKLTETLKKTKIKAAFYRKLGEAVTKATPTRVGTKWQSSEAVLSAEINGKLVHMSGSYERSYTAGLLNALAIRAQPTGVIETVEYSGELSGNAIFGQVKRWSEASSLLAEIKPKGHNDIERGSFGNVRNGKS